MIGGNMVTQTQKSNPEEKEKFLYVFKNLLFRNGSKFDNKISVENELPLADVSSNNENEISLHKLTKRDHGTSFSGTIIHMILLGLSPTMMSLPFEYCNVGLTIGTVVSFLTVMFYAYCMHMIVTSESALCHRLRKPNASYTQLVFRSIKTGPKPTRWLAKYSKLLIYFDFILVWEGGSTLLVLLISENFKAVLDYFYDINVQKRTVILYLIIPLVLLCWIPNLKLLVMCSIFTSIINVGVIVVILYTASQNLPPIFQNQAFVDITKIPHLIGTVFGTINVAGIILSFKREMKEPKKLNSKFGAINLSYGPVGILFAIFGFVCYTKYGANTQQNVILNLPENLLGKIVIGFYGLSMTLFYPLISYVTFDIIWNEIVRKKLKTTVRVLKLQEYSIRTSIVLVSVLLAYTLPQITLFLSVSGTVGTSLDSIIFPALIEMLVFSREKRYLLIFKNALLIVFGLMLIIAGCVDSYFEIVEFFSK